MRQYCLSEVDIICHILRLIPFTSICDSVQFVITFVLLGFMESPTFLLTLFSSTSISFSSLAELANRTMSLSKRRFDNFLPFMIMPYFSHSDYGTGPLVAT